MDALWEFIDTLSNTTHVENILKACIYWIIVIAIMLLIFYIVTTIVHAVKKYKSGKKDIDDFLG